MIRPDDRTPDERQQDKTEDARIQPGPMEYRPQDGVRLDSPEYSAQVPMPIGTIKQIILLCAAMRMVERNMRQVILTADSCRLPIDVALAACAKEIDDQEATDEEIGAVLNLGAPDYNQAGLAAPQALRAAFIIIRRPK